MRLSGALAFLGVSTQIPLGTSPQSSQHTMSSQAEFSFKEGDGTFTPKDLVELGRPGVGVPNTSGDLVLVSYSKYSFKDKENRKSIWIAPVDSKVTPLQLPLGKGGDTFWLDDRTVAHVVEGEKNSEIRTFTINFSGQGAGVLSQVGESQALGSLPTKTASNFRYSLGAGYLVFSDYVYPDGNLSTVLEQDEAWEKRGTTAMVYDATFERHWDTWVGPKHLSLFSIRLYLDPDHKWVFGDTFNNVLKGTDHSSPVEPFGGTDDFDVSKTSIIYTTKDPKLPQAWHTKQNVYITDIAGKDKPRELTSGKQGAIHGPVLNDRGDKAAWLELDKDGYESDRYKIIIYDLVKHVRFTLTQDWDRSPDALSFSKDNEFLYFSAGDHAKIKVFVLPIPPTPSESTTHPKLDAKYKTPIALTHTGAVSGVTALHYGRVLFTRSSLTSPNDVFIIRGLQKLENDIVQSTPTIEAYHGEVDQITRFSADALSGKDLSKGEEFWFKGANDKDVQGWIVKPKGWTEGQKKKYPVVLLIHGGPQGAWEDQWSTRWNPNVFAQQGYFAVLINPTGSTTFGQEFTDAIAEDWGGKPFVDMQNGWRHVLAAYPEIDPERAVSAGASWGGYAINWIQGHPEYGFNFKALVCHDGVFDATYNGYSTDELFFFNHEWGGRPWEKRAKALSDKFSPTNFVHKWSTPQLLIHGSKDYRLPETESIGAFHALQQLGIPSRLVIFPDENHWVLNHGNSLKWHYEVFRWFDQFVGEKK